MASIKIKIKDKEGNPIEITLTDKQKLFCEYYVENFNGADAARRAGYSKDTARQQADQTLSKIYIQQYIDHYRRELYARNRVTVDEIVTDLTARMRLDASDFYDEDGKLKKLSEMSPAARKMIDSIEKEEITVKGVTTKKLKVKLSSRDAAIDKLMKHLGGYENSEVEAGRKIEVTIVSRPENLKSDPFDV